jgi:hypothetical protein
MSELQRAQTGSGHLSPERIEHRTWIKGRAATLLAHYWREDDDPALLAAMGRDWADVLEGLPQEYIQRACIQYQRDEPRKKPTPGAVYQIARALMPKPAPVRSQEPEPERERMSPETAAAIVAAAGFAVKRFGGDE